MLDKTKVYEDETMHRGILENLGRSPSGEKRVRIVLATEARKGPNTQDKAERFMAAIGHHEVVMATYHAPGIPDEVCKSSCTSWLSDSSGRSKVWDFTRSVFMTVGVADTLWHFPSFVFFLFVLVLFVTSWVSPSTSYVIAAVCTLVEDVPVAHFVIRPNYEEDETVLRETLENLVCSSPAEKHMRMVLAMDRLVAATGHILGGCDGHLSSTSYC